MRPMVQFIEVDLAAQRIAVNAQEPSGSGLISIGTVENPLDEFFLEFVYCFLKQNASLDHLPDECFELIFHDLPLRKTLLMVRF